MGLLKSKQPCEDCGSSDALAVYENDDGEQWSTCFSCERRRRVSEEAERNDPGSANSDEFSRWLALWQKQKHGSIPKRMLTAPYVKKYGVVVTDTHHAYPYFKPDQMEPCAFKVRRVADKFIHSVGDIKSGMLFGQPLFGNHKQTRVVITEGELDAIAVHQMFEGKVPVVSIKGGAQAAAKDAKAAFQFLDGYAEIVICFDADEPGKKATSKVAEVFAGKARIMNLDPRDGKDPCDYLRNGKAKEFEKLYWSAPVYTPDGVLSVDDMRALLEKTEEGRVGVYPWAALNAITEGFRSSELITICAGSGLGKSCVLREIAYHIHQTTGEKVGCLFMEEAPKRTIEGFMSLDLNTPLHRDTRAVERGSPEYWASFEKIYGDGRMVVMDAAFDTGASVDDIVGRVRYQARALDVKVALVDHISIMVSAGQHGDERKALDEIMTKLRSLTQDTGIVLFLVSHLKRPEGRGHEEGAATSVSQLRGSAAIAQLSDFVIGLERNGQAEDEEERNTTHIRVLKNRHNGLTGPAGHLLYDTLTGRLSETTAETMEEAL